MVFEGTTIDTVLVDRLDGEFAGPVKVMVTNPVYSQDRQHVLIPAGTFILGDTQKVSGFGQKRLAVTFHRMLMPDHYSVDLDQFRGLDQAGATGLKDKVNNHYVEIFGASIALGVIAGAAEATTFNEGYNESGSEAYQAGIASSLSQSSANVLDQLHQHPAHHHHPRGPQDQGLHHPGHAPARVRKPRHAGGDVMRILLILGFGCALVVGCASPSPPKKPSPYRYITRRAIAHARRSLKGTAMNYRKLLLPALVLALAPAAHAQFGSGIVYDPTQSAHAIQQIEQGSQLYTTAVATRNQIVTMYNLAYQMSQLPQNLEARYKADWSQWTSLQAPPNTYGNTAALVNALNYGALVNAQQGYNSAYVQAQSYPSGSYSSLDSRTQATVANQYATSELAQTTTTNTLATLGTIRIR